MEGRPVAVILDLATSKTDTHLDTPYLADLRQTLTPDAFAGSKDDLLLRFDLIVLEQPDGGALNQIASVRLDNLLEHLGNLALCIWFLSRGLLLLFLVAVSDQTGGNHQPQEQLIRVVCGQEQVGLATGHLIRTADEDVVAHDGTETVDLSAELDLDNLALL